MCTDIMCMLVAFCVMFYTSDVSAFINIRILTTSLFDLGTIQIAYLHTHNHLTASFPGQPG